MQPIRGRGRRRGRGRVDQRGCGLDGGRGHGRDGGGGLSTPEPTLPTLIPPHTYPSPEIFRPPQTDTSPSIPPDTYTSLPYPVSLEPTSIPIDITLSSHLLSSPTLPPTSDTILYLVSELATSCSTYTSRTSSINSIGSLGTTSSLCSLSSINSVSSV